MQTLAISHELLNALQQFQGTTFAVAELTDAYMATSSSGHNSKKAARQFVYRNMLRLINIHMLERVSSSRRWPAYRMTEIFRTNLQSVVPSTEAVSIEAQASEIPSREKLKERLNLHKIEMLTAMGEAEEYDAISKEWPQMRTEVHEKYNQAKDRCSKSLGRVKALEDLLARTSPQL